MTKIVYEITEVLSVIIVCSIGLTALLWALGYVTNRAFHRLLKDIRLYNDFRQFLIDKYRKKNPMPKRKKRI